MKQPQSTYGNARCSAFLLFRQRLATVTPKDLAQLSSYARENFEISRCWQLNPLQAILACWQISKAWFYRLIHKFVRAGLAGLEDRRGRPQGSGRLLNKQERQLLRKLREATPWLGSRRLEAILGSRLRCHHQTIHRFLREAGLVAKRPYKRRRAYQLVRKSRPNARWCLDFTEFYSKVLQKPVFRLEIVDDCTNARLSTALSLAVTADWAAAAVRQAISCFGVPVELHTDNGTQFRAARGDRSPSKAFAQLAAEFGLRLSYASPGCPHENGKAEHACRDFKMEFLSDDQLFELVCAAPTSTAATALLRHFNCLHNWLPNQGHQLFDASPAELHPALTISKQQAMQAYEALYLKPKGKKFNEADWLILQRNN